MFESDNEYAQSMFTDIIRKYDLADLGYMREAFDEILRDNELTSSEMVGMLRGVMQISEMDMQ